MSIELVILDLDAVATLGASTVTEVFGMTPALRRLRARGLKVAVTTDRTRREAHGALADLGWLGGELVDACITASDAPRPAPHPDMVPLAMRELAVSEAYRVAKVSGSPLGLLQGAAAGCSVLIGILHCGFDEAALRGAPCTHVAPTAALVPELLHRVGRRAPMDARRVLET
jgi:beta-phosphoglucomutase-like phosphatase (HAD superfamily)